MLHFRYHPLMGVSYIDDGKALRADSWSSKHDRENRRAVIILKNNTEHARKTYSRNKNGI